jgi:hypothetical protein
VRHAECAREAELLDALHASAWPECAAPELQAHVAECGACAALAAIVLPLLDEHRSATREARVPSSAIVWWRAQHRARLEAARVAAQPIAVLQYVAGACLAGLLAAAVGYVSPAARDACRLAWTNLLAAGSTEILHTPVGLAILAGLTMTLIAAPLAIYLAASGD